MGLITLSSGELQDASLTGKNRVLFVSRGTGTLWRIKNGKFSLDGVQHQLSLNDFGNGLRNHLHGGVKSYDRLNWNTSLLETGDGVVFSILDPHGSEADISFIIFSEDIDV